MAIKVYGYTRYGPLPSAVTPTTTTTTLAPPTTTTSTTSTTTTSTPTTTTTSTTTTTTLAPTTTTTSTTSTTTLAPTTTSTTSTTTLAPTTTTSTTSTTTTAVPNYYYYSVDRYSCIDCSVLGSFVMRAQSSLSTLNNYVLNLVPDGYGYKVISQLGTNFTPPYYTGSYDFDYNPDWASNTCAGICSIAVTTSTTSTTTTAAPPTTTSTTSTTTTAEPTTTTTSTTTSTTTAAPPTTTSTTSTTTTAEPTTTTTSTTTSTTTAEPTTTTTSTTSTTTTAAPIVYSYSIWTLSDSTPPYDGADSHINACTFLTPASLGLEITVYSTSSTFQNGMTLFTDISLSTAFVSAAAPNNYFRYDTNSFRYSSSVTELTLCSTTTTTTTSTTTTTTTAEPTTTSTTTSTTTEQLVAINWDVREQGDGAVLLVIKDSSNTTLLSQVSSNAGPINGTLSITQAQTPYSVTVSVDAGTEVAQYRICNISTSTEITLNTNVVTTDTYTVNPTPLVSSVYATYGNSNTPTSCPVD